MRMWIRRKTGQDSPRNVETAILVNERLPRDGGRMKRVGGRRGEESKAEPQDVVDAADVGVRREKVGRTCKCTTTTS